MFVFVVLDLVRRALKERMKLPSLDRLDCNSILGCMCIQSIVVFVVFAFEVNLLKKFLL